MKAVDVEPQADHNCRGGSSRGRWVVGRGRGHPAVKGRGRARIDLPQPDPPSAS